ncbi:acyl-protein thioesterase 1-like [Durio zibethinus]|uniref:Acyl-protein thioesterase 1-like n=1 Tax=Durio zibethinus TaxID=66656 RepID=A0A6P5XKB3_DURZI|nr:acyl-protein thioesterase 1-like [Durio zibethinus]
MSITGPSVDPGGRTVRRALEFGSTYVVMPKGRHQATIVWLHGFGCNGSRLNGYAQLPPTQPVTIFGGLPSTAWFDARDLSEDASDDIEGLDAAAAHVANLLTTEPADIKLGVGGFSMGAATSLYSATCFTHGNDGNGNLYPANLSTVVGLSGWLPCSTLVSFIGTSSLKNKIEGQDEGARRAASLPVLPCHGKVFIITFTMHGHFVRDGVGLLSLSYTSGIDVVARPLSPFILISNRYNKMVSKYSNLASL